VSGCYDLRMKCLLGLLLMSSLAHAGPEASIRSRAHALEQKNDWPGARVEYAKLEKVSRGEALYGEAFAALQMNDIANATELARRAAEQPGPFKDRARLLHADTIFRSGQFARAKELYFAIHETATGDRRAMIERKLVACDRGLRP
jgi:thioredoxin-like negative regulator of GroEL